MARKSKKTIRDEVHTEAMLRWDTAVSATQDQRALAIEDRSFITVPGSMWEDDVCKKFQEAGKPQYEIDKISPVLDIIKGEQKQAQVGIKFRPMGGGATPDVAKTLNGLMRNVESISDFKSIVGDAFDEMVDSGWCGWRILTREDKNDIFAEDANKEVIFWPISDAASTLWFDPSATLPTKEDARWAFLINDTMSHEEYEEKWPDHSPADWNDPIFRQNYCNGWLDNDSVRVAEYWRKVKKQKTLVKMSDGRVFDKSKVEDVLDELEGFGITVEAEKTIDCMVPEQWILDGSQVLEGPREWPTEHIPLIPGYLNRQIIEGKEYIKGMVRTAKDPSRINNYAVSATVEMVALAANEKVWMTAAQAEGHTEDLSKLNTSNKAVQLYTVDPETGQPPFIMGGKQVQPALVGVTQQATQDIISALGASAPQAMPREDNAADNRSGIAVIEGNRAGQAASFNAFESLIVMYEYTAKQLAALWAEIYDAERQVRIINPDGTEEFVTINETIKDEQTGKLVVVNDLTQGRYDYTVEVGQAYESQRVEAVERMLSLVETKPELWDMAQDIILKNVDVPGSEELYSRVRRFMIQQGLVTPTPEEIEELALDQPQEPSQAEILAMQQQQASVETLQAEALRLQTEAQKNQAQAAKLIAEAQAAAAKVANTDADTANKDADTYKKTTEAQGQILDNIDKTAEMGLPLELQDHDIRMGSKDIVEEAQEEISPGLTSEQAEQLATE